MRPMQYAPAGSLHKAWCWSMSQPQTWVPPGHFYSPLVDTDKLGGRASTVFGPQPPPVGIYLNLPNQLQLFHRLAEYYASIPFEEKPKKGLRYYYDNPQFGYADAIILATMIRHFKPKRIIEVGSGYSSAVMLDINEMFFGGSIQCKFIEPFPDDLHRLMKPRDQATVDVVPLGVEQVGTDFFQTLDAGDFLFIDSTHVSKCDSDVNHHFFRILPSLKPGVFIHFHDIFYPFEYPPTWFFQENRSWNEIYLLRAFLMHNSFYDIQFFNSLFFQTHRQEITTRMPLFLKNSGGSFWVRKRS
jgi:predicted O-methyltransferase YrrM